MPRNHLMLVVPESRETVATDGSTESSSEQVTPTIGIFPRRVVDAEGSSPDDAA
jgi:hypothetical protein